MFGQQSANKPAGLSVNTTGNNLFGQPTASSTAPKNQAASNLFSNVNIVKPAGSGSGPFGGGSSTPAASQPSGTGLFGSPTTTTAPATTSTSTTSAGAPSLFNRVSFANDAQNPTTATNTSNTPTTPADSLFGSPPPATTSSGTSNLFGTTAGTTAPATTSSGTSNLFGSAAPATTSSTTSNLFGSAAPTTTSSGTTGLFGSGSANTTSAPATSSIFSTTAHNNTAGNAGTSLFGGANNNNNQPQNTGSNLFANLGKPAGSSVFASAPANATQQQQQQQGPTLSLFGAKPPGQTTQQSAAPATNTVQGVKIDVSNLVPTTKFEACNPELQNEIEKIDNMIQNQMKMCHEVSDLLPSIISQGGPIPHDVEFVENKLETLQEALELDAAGIEACRTTVESDAAEAKLAFRTIDTLLLPLQYQPTPGERWWSSTNSSQARPGHSLRSALGARHTLLALPKDAEEDPSEQNSSMPANLVEYVSRRAETMAQSADWFRTRLTDIELHVRDLEVSLAHQLNDAVARSRGGRDVAAMGYDPAQSQVAELAGALEDIERAILSVAGRVGETKDQVNEMGLGPVGVSLW